MPDTPTTDLTSTLLAEHTAQLETAQKALDDVDGRLATQRRETQEAIARLTADLATTVLEQKTAKRKVDELAAVVRRLTPRTRKPRTVEAQPVTYGLITGAGGEQ